MDYRILGPLELADGTGPVGVTGARQRALLALLLIHRNELLASERIIDALWGARPPPSAAKAVQNAVSQIRRALATGDDGPLRTEHGGYLLRVAPGELDADRFEALLAAGRRSLTGADAATAADQLREALALWRGPALADLAYEAFAQPEIARLEELRLEALEERIDADLALGRHEELIAQLEPMIARNPLRERLRSQLMLALYRSGRQADALALYRDTRRLLVEELGIEPGRELRELQARILAQDARLELTAPARTAAPVPQLVGRDRDLAGLLPVIDGALAGSGAVLLLAGEPGIGKSRLAETLAAHAHQRGASVAVGRCWETGGAPAYWPWVQALGSQIRQTDSALVQDLTGPDAADLAAIVPELHAGARARSADAEGSRVRLFGAVAAYLRRAAAHQPVTLFLDDLHAADLPSLLLLRFVAAEVPRGRILIVGCYRDTEPRSDLNEVLPDLVREPAVHRHALRPLTSEGTAQVLELVTGAEPETELVEHVHARTEGNPLFAVEIGRLLRTAADAAPGSTPIPAGVTEAIHRRVSGRSERCRETLVLASVIGREFAVDALVHASTMPEDEVLDSLEEAETAGLIGPTPGVIDRLRFSHVLVRDALYDALPVARRLRLHEHAGRALEALYRGNLDLHLSELANHFTRAGRGSAEAAIDYATRAGDHAVSLYAWEDAAQHYAIALRMLEATAAHSSTGVCKLLLALGEALSRAGNEADSKTALRRAAMLAEEQGRPDYLARAALAYGGRIPWARASTDPELVPLLERGLAAAAGDDAMRVRLLAFLSGARRDDSRRDRRRALAQEALAIADRIADPAARGIALEAHFNGADGPDTTDSWLEVTSELIELAERAGDKEHLYTAHQYRMDSYWFFCDRAGIDFEIETLGRLAAELRQPVQQWAYGTACTILASIEGRFEDADRLIAETFAIGQAASTWNAAVSQRLALFALRREQGRLVELTDAMARSVHEFPTLPRFVSALALLQAELDRRADAETLVADLTSQDLSVEHVDAEWLFTIATLTDAVAVLGDTTSAATLYPMLLPYAHLYAFAPAEAAAGCVARALGVLAHTLGNPDDAIAHLEAAVETERRMRATPWVSHAQRALADALYARGASGDRRRAEALHTEAETTYRKLGMTSWAARCRWDG